MDYSEAKELDQATEVTVGEVRAALSRVLMEHFVDVTKHEAETFGTDVVRDIFNNREPGWEVGDVVRDANNAFWQRHSATHWVRMGRAGVFTHERPVRPLTLLDSPQKAADEIRRARSMERARDDGMPA